MQSTDKLSVTANRSYVLVAMLALLLSTSSVLATPSQCQEFIDGEWMDCSGGGEEELPPVWFEPTHDLVMWVPVCDPSVCDTTGSGTKRALERPGPNYVLTRCGRFGLGLSDVSVRPQQYKFAAGFIVQLDPGLGSVASVEWDMFAQDDWLIGAPPGYRWNLDGGPWFGSSPTSIYQSNRKVFPVRYPGWYVAKVWNVHVVTSQLKTCFPAELPAVRPYQTIYIAP